MEVTSVLFYFFVGVSLIIYWKLPEKGQWKLLLIDSILFFLFNASPITLCYVFASVLSVFWAVRYFEKCHDYRNKKCMLILVLLFNIGILVTLKYTNLGIHTINAIAAAFGKAAGISDVNWLAPIAISFYTLQIVSYLLDCYWGMARPFSGIGEMALYTMYFPLMVSGPICRYSEIGNTLFEKHSFDYERTTAGMRKIAWGLVKKLAISNRLAPIVDVLWENSEHFTGAWIWCAAFLFALQLFTDFSGCMDIVTGISQCFGIELPENFNAPFFSLSVQEFWRRWHITLGTWLRDYIMNPILKSSYCQKLGEWSKNKLGKKKGKKVPVYFAMLILWLCMGIWHGNSWKYIVGEGLWFWAVIVFGQVFENQLSWLKSFLHIKGGIIWRFFVRVRTIAIFTVGMLFFRADSLKSSIRLLIDGMKNFVWSLTPDYIQSTVLEALHGTGIKAAIGGKAGFCILAVSFMMLVYVEYQKYQGVDLQKQIKTLRLPLRWLLYWVIVGIVLLSFNIAEVNFAYAQF